MATWKHLDTLEANVEVDAIHGEKEPDGDKAKGDKSISREQYLKLTIPLPISQDVDEIAKKERTHVIIVADNSGSMAGHAWGQVKAALLHIIEESFNTDSMTTDLVTYNQFAHTIKFDKHNYRKVIQDLVCEGVTSFQAAFQQTEPLLLTTIDVEPVDKTIILFFTDGNDTVSINIGTFIKQWQDKLHEVGHPVIVHSVGFSRDHDFQALEKISSAGTADGMFRYCEPDDGPEALKRKLQELFEFVSNVRNREIDIELNMIANGKICGMEKMHKKMTIKGEIVDLNAYQGEGKQREDLKGVSATASSNLVIQAESWIYVEDPDKDIEFEVKVTLPSLEDEKDKTVVPCKLLPIVRKIVSEDKERILWSVRILSRNTDMLTTVFEDIYHKKGDVTKLHKKLLRLQEKMSQVQVYGKSIDKEFRRAVLEHVKEMQSKINTMHSMLADYLRDQTQSVAMLARAKDLRYAAQFSKSRRQRLMDMRISRNVGEVQKAQSELNSLVVDMSEVKSISQEALDFFYCALSVESVQDILVDTDSRDDCIGFGLAVQRPEHVLDDPTSIRICVISGTLVSRSSMMDAWEHKISVDGHLRAHGGFEFFYEGEMGVTTVGKAREPINAWLPLYVCKSHWNRVKTLIKPTLGYFCTLDPLGYDNKQMDVMFLVLGQMIGNLTQRSCGEHQLKIIFSFMRTCRAVSTDFDLESRMENAVRDFVTSPEGRNRDIISNLYTLIGYLVCLPQKVTRNIFKGENKLSRFWLAFITECLRRGARHVYKDTHDNTIDGIMDQVLHGAGQGVIETHCRSQDKEPVVEDTRVSVLDACNKVKDANVCVNVPVFDPAAGVCAPTINPGHDPKVDKAMEIWAQTQFDIIKNKNRAKYVSEAKRLVEKWVKEGKKMAGLSDTDKEEKIEEIPEIDVSYVTQSMLDTLAKVLYRIENGAFPNLECIPGCMAFVEFVLRHPFDIEDMDRNSGLPQAAWIQAVKDAVNRVYTCTNSASNQSKENEDKEVMVTVVPANQPIPATSTETNAEAVSTKADNPETEGEVPGGEGGAVGTTGDDLEGEVLEDEWETWEGVIDDVDVDYTSNSRVIPPAASSMRVTLPVLLHVVDSDLDLALMTRGIVCQVLHFLSNAKMRTGAKSGAVKDMKLGNASAFETLNDLHINLVQRRFAVLQNMKERALWQRANHCMIHASSPWAFAGYLMQTHSERGEGFSELILCITNMDVRLQYHKEKIQILLTGKLDTWPIVASGNMWLPDKKTCLLFQAVLGKDAWDELEVLLRSNSAIHVYRESDIANRHGHCNSNPYIPNELRIKLGMELMPDLKQLTGKAKRDRRRDRHS